MKATGEEAMYVCVGRVHTVHGVLSRRQAVRKSTPLVKRCSDSHSSPHYSVCSLQLIIFYFITRLPFIVHFIRGLYPLFYYSLPVARLRRPGYEAGYGGGASSFCELN